MGIEASINAALRDAARRAAAATPRFFDRFDRPILVGCAVELHNPLPPVYTVSAIEPDLSRNAPVGQFRVTLTAESPILCMTGQRHAILTVVAMPELEKPAEAPPAGDPAASDVPAGPPSSIILTDLDRVARTALEETPLTQGMRLVDPPSNPADDLRIPDEGVPAAADHHATDLGEER